MSCTAERRARADDVGEDEAEDVEEADEAFSPASFLESALFLRFHDGIFYVCHCFYA